MSQYVMNAGGDPVVQKAVADARGWIRTTLEGMVPRVAAQDRWLLFIDVLWKMAASELRTELGYPAMYDATLGAVVQAHHHGADGHHRQLGSTGDGVSDVDESDGDIAPLVQLFEAKVSISGALSAEDVNTMARSFEDQLVALQVQTRERNQIVFRTYSRKEAVSISKYIFNTILGGAVERLSHIADDAEAARLGTITDAQRNGRQSAAHSEILDIMSTSDILAGVSSYSSFDKLMRNLILVTFGHRWRAAVNAISNREDVADAVFADINRPRQPGVTKKASAKLALLTLLGISRARFNKYMADAVVPMAISDVYDLGALCLLPPTEGNGRSRLKYGATAVDVFVALHSVDTNGELMQICNDLTTYVTDPLTNSDKVILRPVPRFRLSGMSIAGFIKASTVDHPDSPAYTGPQALQVIPPGPGPAAGP